MKMFFSCTLLVLSSYFVQGQEPPAITKFADLTTGLVNLDEPNDVTTTGGGIKITCDTTGSLPIRKTWKLNNVEIFSGRGINISKDPAKPHREVLFIKSPLPSDDEGKYQCFANNAFGGTFSAKLRLKITHSEKFSRPESDKVTIKATIGQTLKISCPSRLSNQQFGTIFFWGRRAAENIAQLPETKSRMVLPNGDLQFAYLAQEDLDDIAKYSDKTVQCALTAGNLIYFSNQFFLDTSQTSGKLDNFGPKFNSPDDHPASLEQAIQGKRKEMFCGAVGYPAPNIIWYRLNDDKTSSTKIEEGKGGFSLKDFGRKLVIETVSKAQHEFGYYRCVASNGVGADIKSPPTKLQVFVAPVWTTKPPSVVSIPIESVDRFLMCEASVGTPAPTYKWYYNGTEFKSETELKNIRVDGKYLRFLKMEQSNQGVFQCAVENNYGMLVSSTWVKIKASKPDISNFGPFFLFKTTNATLKCESNAAPRADHTWYRNSGAPITMGGRYSLDVEGSLIIQNVSYTDGGLYKCAARNSIGYDEAESTATVYEKTTIFRRPPANIAITLDKPLDLQCEAVADERLAQYLKYKWLKDNAPLRYTERVKWIPGLKLLRITKAVITDGAMYKCVAYTDTTQYSEDSASSIADVQGVPLPPYDLTIASCSNGTTTITWKKGLDNDSPITKFVLEQESTYEPEEWYVIANITDPSQRQYTLKLTLWADLTFRMRAVNNKGPSRASLPTPKKQCITRQGLPDMFPENLRGIPGKADELDIAWKAMTKLQANAPGLHYILYYAKAESENFLPPVTINDYTIERFKVPNAGYYVKWKFQIVAKNKIGQGPISDIKESFSGQNAPTGKPTNVEIIKVEARSIELTWNRVNIDGRGSIDGYKIYFWGQSKSGSNDVRMRREIPPGAEIFIAEHTTADVQTAVVTGLTPYSSYTLALKAFNSGGEGPSSEEVVFDTNEDVPGEVSTFKAYAFSQYIFASWGEPADKNGILLGYSIAAVKHEENETIKENPPLEAFKNVPTNSFEYLFDNMEKLTRYVVYLRAKTKIGPGPDRIADVKTIDIAIPSRPRAPLVNAKTTTSVNVTFLFGITPGGYPLEFKVKYRETATNGSFEETDWFDHLEKRWAIVDGLAIDILHDFVTVGRNKEGTSVDSPITKARPSPAVGAGKRVSTPFYRTPWFIILMVLILLLLILLLVAILYTRKRGAKYPVGKREKLRAGILDPDEEDVVDMGPMDDNPPPYPSQGSLEKPDLSDDDRDSLDDYGEGPQFKEDGSFIEEYGDDRKKLSDDRDKSATATFV